MRRLRDDLAVPPPEDVATCTKRQRLLYHQHSQSIRSYIVFFARVFEIAPAAASLFSFASAGVTDETYKQELFLKHASGVIGTIDLAINLLEKDDMERLVSALTRLGEKHATYGVKYEHFPIVGEALLDTLAKALGDAFSPETKEAWVGVYGVITEHMSAGMRDILGE
jgi:hemoglobin-like flavoprotein